MPKKRTSQKIIRLPTGIKSLDKMIQGGYIKGSINLVEGGAGSGKTILAIQFLIEGIKNKEKILYITFETNKQKLYQDMKQFGWDLKEQEKKGLFTFLDYTPEQIKRVLNEGGGTIDPLITRKKIKRIVIDSITSFSLLYKDELAKKEAALKLFDMIEKWGCTALLTSEDETEKSTIMSAALDFEVDGIIILYHTKKRGIRKRGIEILKMRGTKHPNKTYLFDIGKIGIIIKKELLR